MAAIDNGSTATYALQHWLTKAERDQPPSNVQKARRDRGGIDTMRWLLANFADKAIDQPGGENEGRAHRGVA